MSISKREKIIEDIQRVLKHHKVHLIRSDNYDDEELFCGSEWFIKGEGIFLNIDELIKD